MISQLMLFFSLKLLIFIIFKVLNTLSIQLYNGFSICNRQCTSLSFKYIISTLPLIVIVGLRVYMCVCVYVCVCVCVCVCMCVCNFNY